jgi:hypothetical protein
MNMFLEKRERSLREKEEEREKQKKNENTLTGLVIYSPVIQCARVHLSAAILVVRSNQIAHHNPPLINPRSSN